MEKDVSRDPAAAHEMVRVSGQYGVPVIVVDGEVVVGFDQSRLERLISKSASAPSLGASVTEARPFLSRQGKLPVDGALVGSVREGSPARRAGLQPGDIIITVDDRPVNGPDSLQSALRRFTRGQRARLRILRNGTVMTLEVTF